ncbi:MAG TPA: hypothetical protein VMC81_06590 [Rhodocyclaceae bacterium]|nr:hypothetical protein [Rhodocyclaceae bacterium]
MIEARFLNARGETPKIENPVASLTVVGSAVAANSAPKRFRAVVLGNHTVTGANMARFLKIWAGKRLDVTLVEPDCTGQWSSASSAVPGSNGFAEFFPYDPHSLDSRYGIRVVGACVSAIDPYSRALTMDDGTRITYDRLEVAPGARLDGASRMAAAA